MLWLLWLTECNDEKWYSSNLNNIMNNEPLNLNFSTVEQFPNWTTLTRKPPRWWLSTASRFKSRLPKFAVAVRQRDITERLSYIADPDSRTASLFLLTQRDNGRWAFNFLDGKSTDVEARHRLRSASSPSLVVRRTRLSTYGDRAFPVAASRVWNSLPHHVTSAQSLPVFCSRLKTHLFSRSFRWLYCCACEVTLVITDTLIAVLTYLLTYLHGSPGSGQVPVHWSHVYPHWRRILQHKPTNY